MNDKACIRVFADVNQINGCKSDIQRMENNIRRVASLFNLAGNNVRLKILFLIYKEGEMCPCDLSDVLNITVPAISQHLRKMKDGGMIRDKKVGQTIFYSIVEENMKIFQPLLASFIKSNKQLVLK